MREKHSVRTTREFKTDHLNFSHISILHYTLFQGQPKSLKPWREGIWYHLKSWKSPHLSTLRFHNNGHLSELLPSCLSLLTVYKYWWNLADSVEVSLYPSSFYAPFFCLMFFVSLFTFCYGLFCAVVWMMVMVLWFLIGALSFGLILIEATEILPIDCLLIYMDW